MEEFFFQGLPLPQGRRFFCPVMSCPTHLLMGFGCVDSLCSHLNSMHQMNLKDLEARCGWPPVLSTQILPLQSAQVFSEPNASVPRNVKNKFAFQNAPGKMAVGFVSERKQHSLEALLSLLTREKMVIQDRINARSNALQEREAQKLRDITARRHSIGELLPKLDSAISRLKSETGSKLTQAILDIGNLAFHSIRVRAEIMSSDVLPFISALLQSRSEAHREHAASAIKNLCLDLQHQRAVRKAGCIPPLVALLRGTRMQRKESLCAIINLVRGDPGSLGNVKNQRAVADAGGLEEIRQINETANDSVRQLTESVLAWMDTFNPNASVDGSSSESGDCDFQVVENIQLDRDSIVQLDSCILDAGKAIAKIAEFRAALPSIQVAHAFRPQSQTPQMHQPEASFQTRTPSVYSNITSSSHISKAPSSHDGPRKMGVRSAAIGSKYFTHLGSLDYKCNTCGATVRDGTRDYHMKRYHSELVQRLHQDVVNVSTNPEHEGEKKVSVLSVTYDNLGDLNFRCKLCGKIVRDGSRDYHIKQHHSDRIEELKEQKRQLIAERQASESVRRFAQMSSPAMPSAQLQDAVPHSSLAGASFSSAKNAAESLDQKHLSPKSHKKKVPPSEPREPAGLNQSHIQETKKKGEPTVLTQSQIQEIKKKGVNLRENEKLRIFVIDSITSFMDLDICRAFRDDEGKTSSMNSISAKLC